MTLIKFFSLTANAFEVFMQMRLAGGQAMKEERGKFMKHFHFDLLSAFSLLLIKKFVFSAIRIYDDDYTERWNKQSVV